MNIFQSTLLLLCVALLSACQTQTKNQTTDQASVIRVGIFDTNGDSPGCITDAYEALRIDSEISPEVISAATILSDDIFKYDAILFPGGSGRAETNRLGQRGMERVKELVTKHGKGVIGICAGSYVLSQTPGYPSLDLSGFKAIDLEHDHRGHGLVKFELSAKGKELFPELAQRTLNYSKYYEGPVLTTPEEALFKGESLATMLSDVHTVEGSPKDMTNNRPFITATKAGKGRVVTFVGHPEWTPGMRWMVPRMVRWSLNKPLISYSPEVVRPEIYKEEILFTSDRLKIQSKMYDQLWGTAEEKIEGIEWLVNHSAWSSKKWIVGLMRDNNAQVRLAAAKAIVEMERTEFIHDLKVAIDIENAEAIKQEMQKLLGRLEMILGENS
ncbi:MAG: DJ-1/PfpI family protein [Marinifilum sp.]|jgi:hypothetical protein|nr:DJ-1/PfpI family protein [Marinifilum sp.]